MLNKFDTTNGTEIRLQPLWHNDELIINRNPVFYRNFYAAGIKRIDHIVREDGTMLNLDEIRQKHPQLRTNFLKLHSLKTAIPVEWRAALRNTRNHIDPDLEDEVVFTDANKKILPIRYCKTRHFYNKQIENKTPAAVHRWEQRGLQPETWRRIFEIPYKCCTSTKLQSLHFRIIHRYIPTKRFLSTRGITGSQLCPHCFQVDDLEHFFFNCDLVKPLWDRVLPLLKSKFRLANDFVCSKTVLLGNPKVPPIVNLILLLTKQYIIKEKLGYEDIPELGLNHLREEISSFCYTEGAIAKKRNKLQKHIEKWKLLWIGDVPTSRPRSPVFRRGVDDRRVSPILLI